MCDADDDRNPGKLGKRQEQYSADVIRKSGRGISGEPVLVPCRAVFPLRIGRTAAPAGGQQADQPAWRYRRRCGERPYDQGHKGADQYHVRFYFPGQYGRAEFHGCTVSGRSADSLEKAVRNFSELIQKKGGDKGKVIIFVDGLDRLAPAEGVELLEAMRDFFDCEGCVFVVAADYSSVIRGAEERYGQDFDEKKGKNFLTGCFRYRSVCRRQVFRYRIMCRTGWSISASVQKRQNWSFMWT